jgi:alkanesulfonate monooxygenase SsuD/methylene tetrahydromethanopterin reductase-like flavin-dependent oxidoreductase (luciferase family)
MPLFSRTLCTSRLGLLLPPMPPAHGSSTVLPTNLPTFGSTQWVSALAAGAEEAGAGGIWVTDHLFWRVPTIECLTTVAVAASATHRAILGSCVLQLPLRAAAVLAKQAAALQVLSGGRFVLGVGIGSHRREYDLAGVPFARRGTAFDSGIAALRSAWHGEASSSEPHEYRLAPAPPVPVWVGGSSDAALHRAATLGDGWVPLFLGPEEFGASLTHLRALASSEGRDPAAIAAAPVMVTSIGDDASRARASGCTWLSRLYSLPPKAFQRHLVAGSVDHCAQSARAYLDAGATHVIVMIAADNALEQFTALAAPGSDLGAPGDRGAGAVTVKMVEVSA